MERVAFLIESTNERFGCLLNPENLVMRRLAGIQPRRIGIGTLTRTGQSDAPLLFTGGGRTELDLDLLFDVSLTGSSVTTDDVRQLTGPLWKLAENTGREDEYQQPPLVRFIWGKSWNLLGIVVAVAERLEQFTPGGAPQRSWLRLRLLRVPEPPHTPAEPSPLPISLPPEFETEPEMEFNLEPELPALLELTPDLPEEQIQFHEITAGERLDEIAFQYYGDASLWRLIAQFNGIDNPLDLSPGQPLLLPPLEWLQGAYV